MTCSPALISPTSWAAVSLRPSFFGLTSFSSLSVISFLSLSTDTTSAFHSTALVAGLAAFCSVLADFSDFASAPPARWKAELLVILEAMGMPEREARKILLHHGSLPCTKPTARQRQHG